MKRQEWKGYECDRHKIPSATGAVQSDNRNAPGAGGIAARQAVDQDLHTKDEGRRLENRHDKQQRIQGQRVIGEAVDRQGISGEYGDHHQNENDRHFARRRQLAHVGARHGWSPAIPRNAPSRQDKQTHDGAAVLQNLSYRHWGMKWDGHFFGKYSPARGYPGSAMCKPVPEDMGGDSDDDPHHDSRQPSPPPERERSDFVLQPAFYGVGQ